MLLAYGKRYALRSQATKNIEQLPAGCNGWYRPAKGRTKGVYFYRPDGALDAYARYDGLLVSASHYDGVIRYMYSTSSLTEQWLGVEDYNHTDLCGATEKLVAQAYTQTEGENT